MAAWVPDMFCYFYLAKNLRIANDSTTSDAGEKLGTDMESLEFYIIVGVRSAKFKSNLILLKKIIHRFLETTKIFTG